MDDDQVVLDEHRGMAAQKATEMRRLRAEVEAQRAALQQRQAELEQHFLAGPSATWEEAAEKARYLINLLADTPEGRDPRRQRIIASVLSRGCWAILRGRSPRTNRTRAATKRPPERKADTVTVVELRSGDERGRVRPARQPEKKGRPLDHSGPAVCPCSVDRQRPHQKA